MEDMLLEVPKKDQDTKNILLLVLLASINYFNY